TLLAALAAAAARLLCVPLGESWAPVLVGVPGVLAEPVDPTEARFGAFAAGPALSGPVLAAGEAALAGAAVRPEGGCVGPGFGWLATVVCSGAIPFAGCTSLAPGSAPEVLPFPGSSVSS